MGLVLPALAPAQQKIRMRIDAVRVGFPSVPEQDEPADSRRPTLFKAGEWTPVHVAFTSGSDGMPKGAVVSVECEDSDGLQNTYHVAVSPLGPLEPHSILAYAKPGNIDGQIRVTLNVPNHDTLVQRNEISSLELDQQLIFSIGHRLSGLRQFFFKQRQARDPNEFGGRDGGEANWDKGFDKSVPEPPPDAGISDGAYRHVRHAFVDADLRELPDRWFGYKPVDVVIFTTGNERFVTDFLNANEANQKQRQQALAEWVRRGGRIVISAGVNQHLVKALLEALDMDRLPIEVGGGLLEFPRLTGIEQWVGVQQSPFATPPTKDDKPGPPVAVARIKVKSDAHAQILAHAGDGSDAPLVVRAAHGLGQVTLIGFDLDTGAFLYWKGQPSFWKRLLPDCGIARTSPINWNGSDPRSLAFGSTYDPAAQSNQLLSQLRHSLEVFPDVANISFGWVALFIFIYILVVGPLDYFFLKKVVKRLELTWITFPTIVLLVSVVAYFTAYHLKGSDLLINKVDLVDIDLTHGDCYGATWFTLFSPRIQNYTIGVEPHAPTWVEPPEGDRKSESVVMSWMGKPDTSFGGSGRSRSPSLFRRPYDYKEDARGLEGVPIQVWSMKSFEASWHRPLAKAKSPITAKMVHSSARIDDVSGSITNDLSVAISDCVLLYGGTALDRFQVIELGELKPGETRQIVGAHQQPIDSALWFGRSLSNRNRLSDSQDGQPGLATATLFRRILYAEKAPSSDRNRAISAANFSLSWLDQSWRLALPGEAVLVGTIASHSGDAETITASPASPTRLWLGKLPEPGAQRDPLVGTLAQETHVRIFIPLRSSEK
jgi:hypothetical protein